MTDSIASFSRDDDWKEFANTRHAYFARLLLAEFIKRMSADDNTSAWYFSVRGNCRLSLNRVLGLSPRSFAALLLAADFVQVRTNGVRVNKDNMEGNWLKREHYGLGGDRNGCAEMTKCEVNLNKLNPGTTNKFSKLELFRIGNYEEEGETIKASIAINDGVDPPPLSHRLRTLQRWLSLNIREVIAPFLEEKYKDKLQRVEEWVKHCDLDDSLVLHYNLDTKRQTVTTTVPTTDAAVNDHTNNNDEEEDGQKYLKGANYGSGNVPKMPTKSQKMATALDTILSRAIANQHVTVTFNVFDGNLSEDSDDDEDDYVNVPSGADYNEDFEKEFPLLSQYALPLFNSAEDSAAMRIIKQSTRSNLLRDVVKLRELHDEPLTFESENSVHQVQLMPVGNDGVSGPLDTVMGNLGDQNGVETILKYLTENHREELIAELTKLKLIPKLLDEYDIAALIDHANIDITRWKKVAQALKTFQGLKRVSVSADKFLELGEGAGGISYKEWPYESVDEDGIKRTEKIKYWWKDVVSEVTTSIARIIQATGRSPDDIEYIHICHGADHGKSKFRFTTKVLLKIKDGPIVERLLPIGDILCKKDAPVVLRSTLIPEIAVGVNRLVNEELKCYKKDDDWVVTLENVGEETVSLKDKVTNSCAGDLAYIASSLGKDGFEGDWCNWCDSFKSSWKDPNSPYNLWTIDRLKEQAKKNYDENLTGTDRKGVKTWSPFFDIPVKNIIFSVLHAQMGVGNKILDYLVDTAEQEIEKVPPEMIALRNDVTLAETHLAEVKDYKSEWEKLSDGGKELKSLQGQYNRRKEKLERPNLSEETILELEWEMEEMKDKIDNLALTRHNLQEDIDRKVTARNDAKKLLGEFKRKWKKDGESIYGGIDKILQKYGIERSAYHGGQINGVHVRILMAYAADFMKDVKEYLLAVSDSDNAENSFGPDKIAELCRNCEAYLGLWDAAFAAVHVQDPTEDDCNKAQLYIDLAMRAHRLLGFNVTPKTHGMEKHVVDQMRRFAGGIAKLIEHWVEHYHQIGHGYDMKWNNQPGEERKAEIRASREYIFSLPEVVKRRERVINTVKRKASAEALVAAEDAKRRRIQRRDAYVTRAIAERDAAEAAAAAEGGNVMVEG